MELKRRDMQPYDFAIKNLDVKKKVKSNPKILALPNSLVNSNGFESKHPVAVNTPRTRSKLLQFRVEKKGALKLSPVDDESLQRAYTDVRPKSPALRKKKITPSKDQKLPKTPKYPSK